MLNPPAEVAYVVTPSDSVNFPQGRCRALWIGATGTVTVKCGRDSDDTVQFVAVPPGSILPVRAHRVNLTGTSATSIVALY